MDPLKGIRLGCYCEYFAVILIPTFLCDVVGDKIAREQFYQQHINGARLMLKSMQATLQTMNSSHFAFGCLNFIAFYTAS